MKKPLLLTLLIITLSAFTTEDKTFVGKILYKYSFTDLKGNDITAQLAPFFGQEQHFYINDQNYKAHDEKKAWIHWYNGETNSYYYFNKDNFAKKYDAALETSKTFKVTKLDKKEKIAGYDCESIQVETDNATIIYFFNKAIKTNVQNYSKHNYGEWNKYIAATDGALSLKFIMTDHKNGYIWTSVATELTPLNLTASDFVLPKDITIKK